MTEGPTAEPEPVPWGTEADPFPVGTVITMPARSTSASGYVDKTVSKTHPSTDGTTIVMLGYGFAAKEVQGRIEQMDWSISGYDDDVDVSRAPIDYKPTDHFLIRTRSDYGPTSETRTDPPITSWVTRGCIRDGDLRDARGDCRKFVAEVDGVEWHLVFSDELVLTAYAPQHHTPADSLMEVSR